MATLMPSKNSPKIGAAMALSRVRGAMAKRQVNRSGGQFGRAVAGVTFGIKHMQAVGWADRMNRLAADVLGGAFDLDGEQR